MSAPWDWKRYDSVADVTVNALAGKPASEGQYGESKGHELYAIEGQFGERLFWKCEHCGIVRQYARDIDVRCPAAE